jgi:hypothetical protein
MAKHGICMMMALLLVVTCCADMACCADIANDSSAQGSLAGILGTYTSDISAPPQVRRALMRVGEMRISSDADVSCCQRSAACTAQGILTLLYSRHHQLVVALSVSELCNKALLVLH